MPFTVSLAVPQNNTATVDGRPPTAPPSAGQDYEAASGTIEFAPGETTKTFTVNVIGDFAREADEEFFVRLSDP